MVISQEPLIVMSGFIGHFNRNMPKLVFWSLCNNNQVIDCRLFELLCGGSSSGLIRSVIQCSSNRFLKGLMLFLSVDHFFR